MSIVVIGTVFVDVKGFPEGTYIPAGRNAGNIEEVHGGVARNVAENIANVELRPTFVSLVDESGSAKAVVEKLKRHKINTDYVKATADGMGTWLAIFDHTGDVVASISKRPNLMPMVDVLKEHGEEIFKNCDTVAIEIDIDKEIVKEALDWAEKYKKPVYALISNMTIAIERRDFIKRTACFVCNEQEAEMFFYENLKDLEPEEMAKTLSKKIKAAGINSMIVTMGGRGAAYASSDGSYGVCQPKNVSVIDTTGAGDAFFSGVTIGLTYGKTMAEACEIGSRMAASVICTKENTCPRFLPEEFGLESKG